MKKIKVFLKTAKEQGFSYADLWVACLTISFLAIIIDLPQGFAFSEKIIVVIFGSLALSLFLFAFTAAAIWMLKNFF